MSVARGRLFYKTNIYLAVALMIWLSVSLLATQMVKAAGETITGATNKTGLVDEYISLGSLHISAVGNPTIPLSIYVPFGELSMTTTAGLTFQNGQTGSSITFSGSLSDVNAALATLRYRTTRAGTVTVNISMSAPGEVYYPGNVVTADHSRIDGAYEIVLHAPGHLLNIGRVLLRGPKKLTAA